MKKVFWLLCAVLSFSSCAKNGFDNAQKLENNTKRQLLTDQWYLQPSSPSFDGANVSASALNNTEEWKEITVPSTVLGALVNAGKYKNLYADTNLTQLNKDDFTSSWIYSKSFTHTSVEGESVSLDLDGINYYANVWLNGRLIADTSLLYGVYKQYDLDISSAIQEENHLVIEVFPPSPGDFTIGFVDWAPVPADFNMGIWREVAVVINREVTLSETFVYSDFDVLDPSKASLFASCKLTNHTDQEQEVTLNGTIENDPFSIKVLLKANEIKDLSFTENEVSNFLISQPKLWWPHNYGNPELYSLCWSAVVNNRVSSSEEISFGIRKVEDYINESGHRGYSINGKEILIKGAGWVDELFLNNTVDFDEAQIKYAKQMNLNTIRFEGFWGKNRDLYRLCDEHGLLAMVGFSCQWEWSDYLGGKKFDESEEGFGGVLEPEEIALVSDYFETQVKWLRNHPSIFVYSVGSDRLPHPDLEVKERKTLEKYDPSRPLLTSAKYMVSEHSGPSAVKMEGPYDYVTPNYWYKDTLRGGAFGFNTETGPGPQPPVIYSIDKMITRKEDQWPLDNTIWKFHSGRHAFGDMSKFLKAFNARYGASENIGDFAKYAQVATYEAMRPMYEAFAVNRPKTTGIVQWMLNSAWPESYWQLYDSYLHPNGAFYGAMHGARDLNVIYSYGDEKIYVSNESLKSFEGQLFIKVFDKNSKLILENEITVNEIKGSKMLFDLTSAIDKDQLKEYFIDLRLVDQNYQQVADNFYWLSSKPDVIDQDYENSSWIYTPNISFTNLEFLRSLPKVSLDLKVSKKENKIEVLIINSSENISFFNEFTLLNNDEPVLPVYWSDNYVTLLPGESKTIVVKADNLNNTNTKVVLSGINSELK